MPRFIHLNGMPGIGKSTVADLFIKSHPGTLNLDIDLLYMLVGGWQDLTQPTHEIVRPIALAAVSAHLSGGRDVILPYYLGLSSEVESFEFVANEHRAEFIQVTLMDSKESALARFESRNREVPWNAHASRCVQRWGGAAYLEHLYNLLEAMVEATPSMIVIPSIYGAETETLDRLVSALTSPSGAES